MSLGKLTNIGERLDLELRQGTTFGPIRHTLANPPADANTPSVPVDLTGCVVRGSVRRKALDPTIVALFDIAYATDPTQGWYTFGLSDEITAAIPCGDKIGDPASLYEWDIEIEDSLGQVFCLFYGAVRIKPEVTRP